ncbi:OmpA family protein [Ochrobactrum sp. S1502_03]
MSLRYLFCFIFLLCGVSQSPAIEHPSYSSQNPIDLMQRSLKTPSAAERAIIRSHLADAHSETAEGLFSAAWIAGVDGRADEQIRLYEAAIIADPELTVAYINLAVAHERASRPEAARDLYDQALTTAPFDVDLVRNGFFLRKEKVADKKAAMDFLNRWEQEVGEEEYAFDFVRGLDAEADGRYAEAEKSYQNAISKDAPFEVYEKLAILRRDKLSDDTMPKAERLAYVSEPMSPLIHPAGEASAYFFVGRMLRDQLGSNRYAVDYLKAGFAIHPTAEVAEEIFLAMTLYDFDGAQSFLEDARSVLPDNYFLKNTLAWLNYNFLPQPDKAAALALDALALAPHEEARLSSIISFGTVHQSYGNFDHAYGFYREKLSLPWSVARRQHLLKATTENRIAAQQFADAKVYLDEIQSTGNAPSEWLSWKSSLIENALVLQKKPYEPLIPDALISEWQLVFGRDKQVNVTFAFDSDVLLPEASIVLDKVAEVLKSVRRVDAALSIEGHTDATGSVAVNDDLSLRRARGVQRYLIDKHSIEPWRVQVNGFGIRFPIASNEKRKSRSSNRRVEIRPLATGSERASSLPSALKGNAFAPDAYRAVFGQEPPQTWDVRAGVKQHNLYRGRNHRFSPDGHYIATISSYREATGQTTEAAYIYDAASGYVIAQIHESQEIIDLVWRPDGNAVAFSTADGFLKLYDIKSRKFAAVTRMGPVRIGGPLAWLPDGNAIASGQHQMREIVVRNPQTLAELRRLDGVNWPHTIGASRDSRYILVFDNRHQMSVWNTRDWSGPRKAHSPMIPLQLEFHPNRPYVALNAKFEASATSLAVMDFERMKTIATWSDRGTYSIEMSSTGETLLAAKGEQRLVFNIPSLRTVQELQTRESSPQ